MAADEVDKCTPGKERAELDIKDETNHLPLDKCDFGSEVTQALKNASKERREQSSQKLKAALVTIVVYFQKNLPLKSKLLISLQYLGPTRIKSKSSDLLSPIWSNSSHMSFQKKRSP